MKNIGFGKQKVKLNNGTNLVFKMNKKVVVKKVLRKKDTIATSTS